MNRIILLLIFSITGLHSFAFDDTLHVPLMRQSFHDKIIAEQRQLDKVDGKQDNHLTINSNEEINLHVTDAVFRKTEALRKWVEDNNELNSNNEKVRYLRYIENMLKYFRIAWRQRAINPTAFPALRDNFEKMLIANLQGKSLLPYIQSSSYEIAKINADVFSDNPDYKAATNIIYLKYCALHPDKIMASIRPFVNEPFADSLVLLATQRNPVQLYSYAQSIKSPEGKLIHRNTNEMVQAVAKLSQTPNALFYFPFLLKKKEFDSKTRIKPTTIKG